MSHFHIIYHKHPEPKGYSQAISKLFSTKETNLSKLYFSFSHNSLVFIFDNITIRLIFEVYFTKLHSSYIPYNYLSVYRTEVVECHSTSKYTHYCAFKLLSVLSVTSLDLRKARCREKGNPFILLFFAS